jgi:WD40 repeat-containing protein SMU1
MDALGGGGETLASPLEIDGGDVVRVLLQFLRENGLERAAAALSDESGVALNSLPDGGAAFASDVGAGRWEAALAALAPLKLPPSALAPL